MNGLPLVAVILPLARRASFEVALFCNSACRRRNKKRDSSGQIGVKADERPGYLQPRRSLGHDYAGSTAWDQAVFESVGFEGASARPGDSLCGWVLPALRTDERRASSRRGALRTTASGPDLPISGTEVLVQDALGRPPASRTAGQRSEEGAV